MRTVEERDSWGGAGSPRRGSIFSKIFVNFCLSWILLSLSKVKVKFNLFRTSKSCQKIFSFFYFFISVFIQDTEEKPDIFSIFVFLYLFRTWERRQNYS